MLKLIALAGGLNAAVAWGPEGHEIVAFIAEDLASDALKAKFGALLKKDGSEHLADVAAWADSIRQEYPWSEPLHFIDLPDKVCRFDWERDCKAKGMKDFCVAGSVRNYTNRLADTSLEESDRVFALKMLVHFVGDIHQPLHCGFTTDRGGNEELVNLAYDHHIRKKMKLHAVWDSTIIDEQEQKQFNKKDWHQFAKWLQGKYLPMPHTLDLAANYECPEYSVASPEECINTMAWESGDFACNTSYVHTDGTWIGKHDTLTQAYFFIFEWFSKFCLCVIFFMIINLNCQSNFYFC